MVPPHTGRACFFSIFCAFYSVLKCATLLNQFRIWNYRCIQFFMQWYLSKALPPILSLIPWTIKKTSPAGQRWVLEQWSDFSLIYHGRRRTVTPFDVVQYSYFILVYHIFIIFMLLHQFPSFLYILQKVTDGPTDRRTDRPTDGHALI